jgi:hypothetical protein
MVNNEKHRKAIRFITKFLLFIFIFWFTQTLVDINRPARLGSRKVDTIKIMGDSKEIFVRNQERIDMFVEQMKYKFVVPSYYKEPPLNEGYYVLAFFKDNKLVGIFAYNIEKKLLQPRGKPLSSDLYGIIESFIKESSKPN